MLTPKVESLNMGDRIIIFTDGYLEYVKKKGFKETSLPYVIELFSSPISLEDCIININRFAWTQVRKVKKRIEDDYTVISLEMKNS